MDELAEMKALLEAWKETWKNDSPDFAQHSHNDSEAPGVDHTFEHRAYINLVEGVAQEIARAGSHEEDVLENVWHLLEQLFPDDEAARDRVFLDITTEREEIVTVSDIVDDPMR